MSFIRIPHLCRPLEVLSRCILEFLSQWCSKYWSFWLISWSHCSHFAEWVTVFQMQMFDCIKIKLKIIWRLCFVCILHKYNNFDLLFVTIMVFQSSLFLFWIISQSVLDETIRLHKINIRMFKRPRFIVSLNNDNVSYFDLWYLY